MVKPWDNAKLLETLQAAYQIRSANHKGGAGNKQFVSHTLKFAAPYTYEGSEKAELKGKTFDSIDLSGVGELNTMSESMAENRMAAGGFAPVNTHRNYLYCCIIASMGTGYPVDFFAGLPLCEAVKLRDAVNSDFFE